MKEIISDIITIRAIFLILMPVVVLCIGFCIWLAFYYRKERRLFKNIRRTVYLLGSSNNQLKFELSLLKKVGFFKVKLLPEDKRSLDLIDGKETTLIILGYEESDYFKHIFSECRLKKIPTIVYSKPGEVSKEELSLIQKHSYHNLCNAPLRLISDVFNIMATWPERK